MELPDKSAPPPLIAPGKNLKPVVTGAVKVQRPATRRFMDFLLAESPKEISKRVGRDVVVPRLKAGLEEAFNSFLSGMLWGNGNRPMSGIIQGTVLRGGMQNYAAVSQTPPALLQARAANVSQTTSSGKYQDLVVPTQQFAETLLANMYDLLNQYRVVAVADLYELAGITPAISDNAFGWVTFDGARISKIREGYLLELPRPNPI